MEAFQVFTNQTADGDSEVFGLNGNTRVRITGILGGGTIEIHSKSNNSNDSFSTIGTEHNRTEIGEFIIEYKQGWSYKLVLTGATTPSINAFVSV